MKVLGVIPARGGSKGIPRKNIRLLNGQPLIAYTIQAALASNLFKTIVSTEDEEIATVASMYGAEIVKRPKELAADDTPTLPVLQHALEAVGEHFDAVMTLQPTSPLRKPRHINEAIELFCKHPSADSLISLVRVPHNMTPVSQMKKEGGWMVNYLQDRQELILRRQEKPELWARNGATIYLTRSSRIGEYVFGGNILPYEMSKLESIDIDDEEDWMLAEMMMNHKAFSGQIEKQYQE